MKKFNIKNLLFPVYLIARILKMPFFWIEISNFRRWKDKKDYIQKDGTFIFIVAIASLIWIFLSGWLFWVVSFVYLIILFSILKIKE